MAAHFKIVSTGPIHPAAQSMLTDFGNLVVLDDDVDETLFAELADADALIVRRKLPDDVFDHAPRLQIAVRHGVGLDFIPVAAATRAGVVVANLPDTNANAVAEHVAGLMLQIARRFGDLEQGLRAGDWGVRHAVGAFELQGRTLGVLGVGRVGRRIAAIAHGGLAMDVVGYDPVPVNVAAHVELCSPAEVFSRADIVTVHTPLNDETRGLVGAELIGKMKPDAWLINAARGEIVDDEALVAALTEKRIAGAALDVFDPEPLPEDSPYRDLDNVILTPHTAGMTRESIRRMSVGSAEELMRVLSDEKPENFVNPQVWERRRRPAG